MEKLIALLEEVFSGNALIALTLSDARERGAEALQKVSAKPILLRGERVVQFEYHYARRVTHRNLTPDEARALIAELLTEPFRQGQFFTTDADIQTRANRPGSVTIRRRPPTKQPLSLDHNREKQYLLPEGTPVAFLVRLGVMTAGGKVIAAKRDKFRQINRFLEMADDTLDAFTPGQPLRVIDFGCGKSYLTFALYHFLRNVRGYDAAITGLDLKRDVVEDCQQIARDLGFDALTFAVGDIRGYEGEAAADIVVTLHACDTATDDALGKAVAWGASVILSVPCCHHELLHKIDSPALRPLLKHGILKERLASLVTDALRAERLEMAGYHVQLLEFIDLEHTAKNLLIRAVKGHTGGQERAAHEYEVFRDFWSLEQPYLETALPIELPVRC